MRKAHDIEAILFDVGDTLVHFATSRAGRFIDAAAQPAHRKLTEWGFPVPAYPRYTRAIKWALSWAYLRSLLRQREVQIVSAFDRCHRRMGITIDVSQAAELKQCCIAALRPFMELDDHAQGVVAGLHRKGLKLGLVSNTPFPAEAIDDVLAEQGLLEYFPVRIYSSDVRYRKPHPKIFKLALEQIGTAAERTLFVGDRMDKDVVGAARVGMRTALFVRNGSARTGRGRPDHVLHQLTDLSALFEA